MTGPDFNKTSMIPVIAQDFHSGKVLMLAYMNAEALKRTLAGPDAWFYSRSRQKLWHKGETSGNFLKVMQVEHDCDSDTVLVKVIPSGSACHTGSKSCFDAGVMNKDSVNAEDIPNNLGPGILTELIDVIKQRSNDKPGGSYTVELLKEGTGRVAQKIVEEAGETAIASVNQTLDDVANEMGDLLYHCMVLLVSLDMPAEQVWEVLAKRRG